MSSLPAVREPRPRAVGTSASIAWRVFGEGDLLYAAMISDITSAKTAVRLESYIFAADDVGWRFAGALAERARDGVAVLVHIDAAGAVFEGTDRLFRYLRNAGVDARWFNRWQWRRPLKYNRRNHRKLLVVDDTCLYVGGFNIHRQSAYAQVGEARWRDVHARVTGPLTAQAIRLFDTAWSGQTERVPPPWAGDFRLFPNTTRTCRRMLHCLVLDALAAAEQRVVLATAYFVPHRRLRAALASAAARGVEVRVLTPAKSDQPIVRWAGHRLARSLARRGVQFFEYQPRMLHSKVLVVDDGWASVGSANTDYRSFFVNRELNLVTRDPAVCGALSRLLADDFAQSTPLILTSRPRGRLRALAEALAHRMRRWL